MASIFRSEFSIVQYCYFLMINFQFKKVNSFVIDDVFVNLFYIKIFQRKIVIVPW